MTLIFFFLDASRTDWKHRDFKFSLPSGCQLHVLPSSLGHTLYFICTDNTDQDRAKTSLKTQTRPSRKVTILMHMQNNAKLSNRSLLHSFLLSLCDHLSEKLQNIFLPYGHNKHCPFHISLSNAFCR